MRERRALPQLATFAGGMIAASAAPSATGSASPSRVGREPVGHGRPERCAPSTGVTVAGYDVVLRLPAQVVRSWRASALGADLELADVIALLVRRHRQLPTAPDAATPGEPGVAMTVAMDSATLAALDDLREATGAADRSSLCAVLLGEHLRDQWDVLGPG